jgi:hypothetical protein
MCNLRFEYLTDQVTYSSGSKRNIAPLFVHAYTAVLVLSSCIMCIANSVIAREKCIK